ncbi:hypothetical protein UVI_02059670 [Ustilaginoidea virens]|uniref:Uncharacterized protein n=1 Tax=Ustilaginoidea virens TaxID=1159556 RepID=A0A1B5L8D0_USTVR|nr:hypothetical protein UVI_02059670 [Ustilaginoidea virens]
MLQSIGCLVLLPRVGKLEHMFCFFGKAWKSLGECLYGAREEAVDGLPGFVPPRESQAAEDALRAHGHNGGENVIFGGCVVERLVPPAFGLVTGSYSLGGFEERIENIPSKPLGVLLHANGRYAIRIVIDTGEKGKSAGQEELLLKREDMSIRLAREEGVTVTVRGVADWLGGN